MISSTSSSLSHEKYLKNKRNNKLFRYGLVFFLFVSFIALASYGAHRPEVRISEVELSGGVLVTQTDIETKTSEYTRGSYIWLFPKNNIFIYSNSGLEKFLKENFKRIDTIKINRKDFKVLSIDIKERKPVAMWCEGVSRNEGDEDTELSRANCYFIDQNSTIFAKAPTFSGDAYFRFYGLVSEDNPIGKEYMASSTQFAEISSLVIRTKQLSLRPQYLVAKEGDEFGLFIAGGGEIMFDTKVSLVLITQNLEALLRTPALVPNTNGILPIEYIDLRYGNKLFYKLK